MIKPLLSICVLSVLFSCTSSRHVVATAPNNNSGTTARGPVLQLVEKDPGGHSVILNNSIRVVDPNSTLDIAINKKNLVASLPASATNPELTRRLNELKTVLEKEQDAMRNLGDALELFNAGNPNWTSKLSDLYPFVQTILDSPEGSKIYNELQRRQQTGRHILDDYAHLFHVAEVMVKRQEEKIIQEAKDKGSFIQLGVWIEGKNGARPVHVPGFDDYDPSPAYHVQQFLLVLTEEQKEAVLEMSRWSAKFNKNGLAATLKAQFQISKIMAATLNLPSVKHILSLNDTIQTLVNKSNNSLGGAKDALFGLRDELETYTAYLRAKFSRYSQAEYEAHPGDILLSINSDVVDVKFKTEQLTNGFQTKITAIQTNLLSVQKDVRKTVSSLPSLLTSIASRANYEVDSLFNIAVRALQTLKNGEAYRASMYEFTERVKKLSLDNLPDTASLDLESTGTRDIGDKLTLRLVAGQTGTAVQDIEVRKYYLYFCSPYVRTAVGFLFTDPVPLGQHEEGKSLFHYAPSYSILLKGFWKKPEAARQSLSYHRLYSPGIGLNIASIDFNSDGAMEVGLGGVFTIFNDFLQIGYGCNMFDGKGYSFLGLRLPVGAFTIQ